MKTILENIRENALIRGGEAAYKLCEINNYALGGINIHS